MRRRTDSGDPECAIAHASEVIGDWWSLLLLRDVARGRHRFEELRAGLGVSRKVLTERLHRLVEDGVLERHPYSDRPPRHEYRLTARGRARCRSLSRYRTGATGGCSVTASRPPPPVPTPRRRGESPPWSAPASRN
ncbi:winged helix-turn-helix transcriptional regulator [Plantactinospora veratri]